MWVAVNCFYFWTNVLYVCVARIFFGIATSCIRQHSVNHKQTTKQKIFNSSSTSIHQRVNWLTRTDSKSEKRLKEIVNAIVVHPSASTERHQTPKRNFFFSFCSFDVWPWLIFRNELSVVFLYSDSESAFSNSNTTHDSHRTPRHNVWFDVKTMWNDAMQSQLQNELLWISGFFFMISFIGLVVAQKVINSMPSLLSSSSKQHTQSLTHTHSTKFRFRF